VIQLVEQLASDPKFKGSNPAIGGAGQKLQKYITKKYFLTWTNVQVKMND
jgi:hypothetical protein